MKRFHYTVAAVLSVMAFSTQVLLAQMDNLHGTDSEFRMGVHSGNQFRTSFYNDGMYGGRVNRPPEVAGEWPINSGHFYLVDGNVFVGSEVLDRKGNLIHIMTEDKCVNVGGSRGDKDPVTGEWWTFLPLPGFADPNGTRIAMAKGAAEWPDSWPSFWPDKADDPSDPGWRNDNVDKNPDKAAWNGYFGKNVFNADEESYFVADDYMNREFAFYPDAGDTTRKGLGIRVYVRGFQWAKAAVEDAIFCLYDLENIGTYFHDKMVFGYKIGNNMGETVQGGDVGDDNAAYNRDMNIAYMWDNDAIGGAGWGPTPVGYMGGSFLESPGNPYDGIDNDNDGKNFSGPVITADMFQTKTLGLKDQVVMIDYTTFKRKVTTLEDTLAKLGKQSTDTLRVAVNARIYKFWAGKALQEIGDNLFDDNLNGLIDENRGLPDLAGVVHYLYVGYKCVDYLTGAGSTNPMLDERRDDGKDNDGNWDPNADDTGGDGLLQGDPGYPGPDSGEKNGRPDPGEPHFDKTDIHETDMLGLTSFNLYEWTSLNQYDDENYWKAMAPGLFVYSQTAMNVELLYGSGYFPMAPGQIERFSVAVLCGTDLTDILRNKTYVAEAYAQNYKFSKAPYIPTLQASAGDKQVTLFWDDFAEKSQDPILGKDFEGYKIYRSTDPGFNDMGPITDAQGISGTATPLFRKPIVQFDLDNDYSEYAPVATQGVHFWLGTNSGLRHYWTDTTAVNGTRYFYAVTSYDHGDLDRQIDPSECTKFVAVQASGEIELGTNVVVVRPDAPAAGYVPPSLKDSTFVAGPQNTATGKVGLTIMDPGRIKNHTYQISFQDGLSKNQSDSTTGFTLTDITTGGVLLKDRPLIGGADGLPVVNGFQLDFSDNPAELSLNQATWSRAGIPPVDFHAYVPVSATRKIRLITGDFQIIFSDVGVDTSKLYYRGAAKLNPKPVNFTVINTFTKKKVPFAFRELNMPAGEAGQFSYNQSTRQTDEIIFLADPDSLIASWQIVFAVPAGLTERIIPGPGDVLTVTLKKPFLRNDTYTFETLTASADPELAKGQLDQIRVVPNPYIVTNSWEPKNPYANGRGERQLHFTHLPMECTIKIFNVKGQLIKEIEHAASVNDGTEIWNMLSKDNLEISYGIYLYHVKAEGIGEKIGKFVVVK